jgi:hypothetical protein
MSDNLRDVTNFLYDNYGFNNTALIASVSRINDILEVTVLIELIEF